MLPDRRDFLRESVYAASAGLGAVALTALASADEPTHPAGPHFAPKAKAVIWLFMEGGPSHLDLFDPKPELQKRHGQPLPASFGTVLTPMGTGGNNLLATKRTFARHGKSGLWVSDWLPHLARHADDLAVVRSCHADGLNHVGSVCQMNTGSILAGRPSLGAWALYGLGSVNKDLPGFVVLSDGGEITGGPRNWGTGFMPATWQGTLFRPGDRPLLHLKPPEGVSAEEQRRRLDLIAALNARHQVGREDDSRLAARREAYELAFRMQAAAPDAVDLSAEPDRVQAMYGLDRPETAAYGRACLLARRLVERGVRFVQVYCGAGSQWDAHSDIEGNHGRLCQRADKPSAALLADLKARGLLDETLVVWGGEFGRTPMTEGVSGRDHDPYGFTTVFAGGGVKGGAVVGSTDEFGLRAVEDKVHVHDIHATILHLLGFDHRKLTFAYNGRDERLTENAGRVVEGLLA